MSDKHSLIPLVSLDWHQSDITAFFRLQPFTVMSTRLWIHAVSMYKFTATATF